jgi:mannose-6-phosphate isomerase-like protein (cupin superfamily)
MNLGPDPSFRVPTESSTRLTSSSPPGRGLSRASRANLRGGMQKVNLAEKLSQITEHWRPKVVGELNNQEVKLVKFKGEFIWHHHTGEDELFLVVRGSFRVEFRDRVVSLSSGEFVIVPRGIEHRTVADEEVEVLIFEPAATRNTGNIEHPTLTAPIGDRL